MSHKTIRSTAIAALVGAALLSGCVGGGERAETPKFRQCKTLLGAEKVETVVEAAGGDDVSVVASERGAGRMQLIAACAVPGAHASQPTDLPLQFDEAGVSAGTELRWDILSAFARSVVAEMNCVKPPVIPSVMPALT
ncbi:hypothetical protein [Streptomyces californicus]|uniref:hypothetical protein n=1 Tax=Streptomyces californicus TaxID=67351 RepID=UPI00378F86D7